MTQIIGCTPIFFQGIEILYCASCQLKHRPRDCANYINAGNNPIYGED